MSTKLFKSIPVLLLAGLAACSTGVAVENAKPSQTAEVTEVAVAEPSSAGNFTPAENNEFARQMFDGAWNNGDFAVIDKIVLQDAIDHSPLGSETGSESFKQIVGMFRSAMPELEMTIEDDVYAGDRVVHRWKIQGEHTGTPLFGVDPTGEEITLTGMTIIRMEAGKVAERWTQLDQLGLMQQLGVIPPMGGDKEE